MDINENILKNKCFKLCSRIHFVDLNIIFVISLPLLYFQCFFFYINNINNSSQMPIAQFSYHVKKAKTCKKKDICVKWIPGLLLSPKTSWQINLKRFLHTQINTTRVGVHFPDLFMLWKYLKNTSQLTPNGAGIQTCTLKHTEIYVYI